MGRPKNTVIKIETPKLEKDVINTPGNKSMKVMGIEKRPKAQTGMCKE